MCIAIVVDLNELNILPHIVIRISTLPISLSWLLGFLTIYHLGLYQGNDVYGQQVHATLVVRRPGIDIDPI